MHRSRVLVVGMVGAVVAVALVISLALWPPQVVAAVKPAVEPFPSFVMVYRQPTNATGPNGPLEGFQTTRVEYLNRHHWRVVHFDHWSGSDIPGRTTSFDG